MRHLSLIIPAYPGLHVTQCLFPERQAHIAQPGGIRGHRPGQRIRFQHRRGIVLPGGLLHAPVNPAGHHQYRQQAAHHPADKPEPRRTRRLMRLDFQHRRLQRPFFPAHNDAAGRELRQIRTHTAVRFFRPEIHHRRHLHLFFQYILLL